jgi:hypothetical protein
MASSGQLLLGHGQADMSYRTYNSCYSLFKLLSFMNVSVNRRTQHLPDASSCHLAIAHCDGHGRMYRLAPKWMKGLQFPRSAVLFCLYSMSPVPHILYASADADCPTSV